MSSQGLSQPRRGRRYGWWIAGVLAAAAVGALGYAAAVRVAGPAKFMYGLVSGNPAMPGCKTSAAHDGTTGPLWYRVIDLTCGRDSMHFVYAKRGTGPGFFVFPAFMSAGSPLPVEVRQYGDTGFQIVLAQPLPDGDSVVPIELNPNGMVKIMRFYDHGRLKEAKTIPGGA